MKYFMLLYNTTGFMFTSMKGSGLHPNTVYTEKHTLPFIAA